jgi:class 3 adenylate cyclase
MGDFKVWLQSLDLEKYGEVFESHDIDLTVVPDLTEQDLEKLGLSLGHRRKFMAAAAKLRSTAASSTVAPTQPQPRGEPATPVERRQVTVVFIDLVGSTTLSTGLDPEDLLRLLRQYRDACTAVIGKYDGFIAQYLGDGIMVYFGFPRALEHAAERAVRAGLEIVEKVGRLKRPDGLPLKARIGIATGLVVVGRTTGVGTAGEETIVGDIPNLAARLQSIAEPDCVLVGPTTYKLTADFFEYSFLGEHAIKVSASRFQSGRRFVKARPKAGLPRLMPLLPVQSSDANVNWQFFMTRGSARRKATGTSCSWPARPGWASHGCWKPSPSACGKSLIVCCAASAPPTTATVPCSRS